jgi:hypothetical protein
MAPLCPLSVQLINFGRGQADEELFVFIQNSRHIGQEQKPGRFRDTDPEFRLRKRPPLLWASSARQPAQAVRKAADFQGGSAELLVSGP